MSVTVTSQKIKSVKVSRKGQITLPKAFLKDLGINYGDIITIGLADDAMQLFNQKKQVKNKINQLLGSVKPKIKTNLTLEEQIELAKKDHFNQK